MTTVLVVDDVATDRVRAAGLVSRWMDSTVLQAENGIAALAMIEKHQPDMVLTDLHMDGMNGLQLVEAVKNDYPYIPVILMTADGSEDIAAQALQKGAASYVPKRNLAQSLDRVLQQVHVTARDAQIQTDVMHQIQASDIQLILYNDRTLIRSAVGLLTNLLRCMPLGDETERMRTGVALEEAMLNAYYHGNFEVTKTAVGSVRGFEAVVAERSSDKRYCLRRIYVRADISRERAVFVVRDDGSGFDPTPYLSSRHKPLDVHHRGINLMSTIMDDIVYSTTGNEVTMTKRAVNGTVPDADE